MTSIILNSCLLNKEQEFLTVQRTNMKMITQIKPALISYWMYKTFKTFYPNLKYHPDKNAPKTTKELKLYSSALSGLISLPVYDQFCENTIYNKPEDNIAFRAWHDAIHIEHNLGFTPSDETNVANIHYTQLEALRAPNHVKHAIYFDIVAQSRFYVCYGEYVKNQRAFIQDCLIHGIAEAINLHYDTASVNA